MKNDFGYSFALTNCQTLRCKVCKFGRDRAVELHRAEVREDSQFGRRIHKLSGKRLLCHCRATEKRHAENLQDLFQKLHPHEVVVGEAPREVKVILAREKAFSSNRLKVTDHRCSDRLQTSGEDCIFRSRCAGRPKIKNATLSQTLHEEEKVTDPRAERAGRCG